MKKNDKKNLVIVESPAKAKTIEKILGNDFLVTASFGHIRDLPKSTLGVDIENNFTPNYSTIRGKGEVTKNLKALAKKSEKVYLASDPDREGEAIAWHIAHTLKLDENENNRIEFNEITASAIKDAIKHPRKIDMNKVNAQQARRILDRLVGYEVSPLLWKAISSNTSAGRVQSVALKLICELEDSIKAFVPEKFWDITGEFKDKINLALYKVEDKKIDKLKDEKVVEKIKTLKGEEFLVDGAKVTKKTKNPPLPLKTSTLQQLSSSYLGFSATKTMKIAQGLYEGVNINGTHKGLITYMRTDSVRISEEAVQMAKDYILENYGKDYVGEGVKKTTKKQENIQDAHEGIRPTDVNFTPEYLSKFLDKDQLKLYTLIWERFLISQLAPMKYEQFELLCSKDGIQFRGVLNKILFDGYYKLFKDEEDIPLGDFPNIQKDDKLKLVKLNIKEDFTKPPARLTESSLIKKLESDGIGRPSTYAAIINTLKDREYVTLKGKSFVPTELGYEVERVLDENFKNFMNVKFTADMENKLDDIAEGKEKWQEILKNFYTELSKYIEKYKKIVDADENKIIVSDMPCPCGEGYMIMKNGRFGRYLACSNEDCKQNISLRGIEIPMEEIKAGKIHVKDIVEQKIAEKKGKPTDVLADNGSPMLLKFGRFGSYLESENYSSDNIRTPLPSEIKKALALNEIPEENGVVKLNLRLQAIKSEEKAILDKAGVCEKCGRPFRIGKGRWGRYLACTGYPECKNIKNLDKDGNVIEKKEKEETKKTTKKTKK
ncbi:MULTISPECIES: type I DNA topoisomerase [Fusobacterium]|uniref:type I DNA topoisomerase n=1 Tax=Fusobacterium TaxID=848 RepID=UPI001EEEC5B7|nr:MULTISPECIES: type I DNA topoisomerase [Fusobacterium]MCF2612039.1 type I DNA topoisomerase [Fusobacterium perfoetens]MDY2980521.1 type I DNA topoisomerase [Fusobacterium sp.]